MENKWGKNAQINNSKPEHLGVVKWNNKLKTDCSIGLPQGPVNCRADEEHPLN